MERGQDRNLQGVFDAIERAYAARSVTELDAIMAAAFAKFGFNRLSMDQMRDGQGHLVGINHFGNPSPDWTEHYKAQKHYLHDGVIRHAILSPSPVRWLEMAQRHDLSSEEARLFGEASEFGLRDGLVTPVHQIDGNISAVTTTSPYPLDLGIEDLLAVRLLSLYYCSFGTLLQHRIHTEDKDKVELTERQRECLQWVRAGKSSPEIAEKLNVSSRTVDFHVNAACERLGAKTRHQAVMEALARGLIHL